jgi:acetyltransferase-like isoleucine patch superfamily enzyme
MGLRRRLKILLHPPPIGVGCWGAESLVLRPRRIRGARCMEIGSGVTVDRNGWIAAYESYHGTRYMPRIRIGDGVTIGRYFCLTAINRVEIGANCLFSEYIYISDHFHGSDPFGGPLVQQALETKGPVLIGDGTFLGYRACVLPGVSLGKHCVVGANAVVTRSFPDFSMLVGTPARLIKRYVVGKKKWEAVRSEEGGE